VSRRVVRQKVGGENTLGRNVVKTSEKTYSLKNMYRGDLGRQRQQRKTKRKRKKKVTEKKPQKENGKKEMVWRGRLELDFCRYHGKWTEDKRLLAVKEKNKGVEK